MPCSVGDVFVRKRIPYACQRYEAPCCISEEFIERGFKSRVGTEKLSKEKKKRRENLQEYERKNCPKRRRKGGRIFKSTNGKTVQREEEKEGESSNLRSDQAKKCYNEKTRVTKPIVLDDLFKRRCLKHGDPESEVRRVLLYGNPGYGKTCITKVVAHKWALGQMAQHFNAIYVVPVGILNRAKLKGRELTRLEEPISQICFSRRNHPFYLENVITQIEDDLDDPSTLLMIDGLDKANDHAMELLSTVWERSCKVLLLSLVRTTRETWKHASTFEWCVSDSTTNSCETT